MPIPRTPMNAVEPNAHPPRPQWERVAKSAVISDDGLYRYLLTRTWGDAAGPLVVWIMLNPSTADADVDDPTIRRCIRFSRERGFARLSVVNLFALRATNPKALMSAKDPVGPENYDYVRGAVQMASLVVAAWGAGLAATGYYPPVDDWRAENAEYSPVCLGRTKDGHPRHPLYVSNSTPFMPYIPEEARNRA